MDKAEEAVAWMGTVRDACKEPGVAEMLAQFEGRIHTAAEWTGFIVAAMGAVLHKTEQQERAPLSAAIMVLAGDLAHFKDKLTEARMQ